MQNIKKFFIVSAFITTSAYPVSGIEKAQINAWIKKNNLNLYGEPAHTIYKTNVLCCKPGSKELMTTYEYIIAKNPKKPWAAVIVDKPVSKIEKAQIDAWIKKNNLNIYGDKQNTRYTTNVLCCKPNKELMTTYEYIIHKHKSDAVKPWSTIQIVPEKVLAWLKAHGYDEYGNAKGTVYKTSPITSTMSQYDLIRKNCPNKPWNDYLKKETRCISTPLAKAS